MRVSNFLLWQIAYAEIWVTDALWPDFRARHLLEAHRRLPEARSPLRRDPLRARSAPARLSRLAVHDARRHARVVSASRSSRRRRIWLAAAVGDARPGASSRRRSPASSSPGWRAAVGADRAAAVRRRRPPRRSSLAFASRPASRPRQRRRRSAPCCSSLTLAPALVDARVAAAGPADVHRAPAVMLMAPLYVGLPLGALAWMHAIVRSGRARRGCSR